MAIRIQVPADSYVYVGGERVDPGRGSNQYTHQIDLPDGTTEYYVEAFPKLSEGVHNASGTDTIAVALVVTDVTTSAADIQDRLDEAVDGFEDDNPEYGSDQSIVI